MSSRKEVEILLVEDNPNDVELMLRALERKSIENKLLVVKDGVEALKFIFSRSTHACRKNGKNPKVIFLDLKLPKVDGFDVLRQIKSDEKTKSIPVVVFTSSMEEKDIVECYQLGVNSYAVKPMDFDDYASSVGKIARYWLHVNQTVR